MNNLNIKDLSLSEFKEIPTTAWIKISSQIDRQVELDVFMGFELKDGSAEEANKALEFNPPLLLEGTLDSDGNITDIKYRE